MRLDTRVTDLEEYLEGGKCPTCGSTPEVDRLVVAQPGEQPNAEPCPDCHRRPLVIQLVWEPPRRTPEAL